MSNSMDMERSLVTAWSIWTILGFAPTVLIPCLTLRAMLRRDNSAWEDMRDASVIVRWLMPGSAILAAVPLCLLHIFSPIRIAILCITPLIVFRLIMNLGTMAYWRMHVGLKSKSALRHLTSGMGPELCMAIYVIAYALVCGEKFALVPDMRLYLGLLIASWAGWYFSQMRSGAREYFPGKWRLLAPCELFTRVREIAAKAGGRIDTVYMVTEMPFKYAGGFACGIDAIGLTESLISNFRKEEVDIVLAHEVGHTVQRNYWWLHLPVMVLAWLAWLAGVFGLEKMINDLPQSFAFLHYVLWMLAFIVPKLADRWYRRRSERMANEKLSVIDDPREAIACFYKLMIFDNAAFNRPWWSRIISTHPPAEEEIETIAKRSWISDDEVERIKNRAREELEQGCGERYELAFHDESAAEPLERPRQRVFKIAYGFAAIIGFVALIGSFVFVDGPPGLVTNLKLGAAVASAVGLVAVLILLVWQWKVMVWRGFRQRLRKKLMGMYPSAEDSILLVDASVMNSWQGAMVGMRENKLIVLGEAGEYCIDPASVTTLIPQEGEGFESEPGSVTIWYAVDGIPQWLMLRLIGKPEKGLPRSARQMEKWLRNHLTEAGASISIPSKQALRIVWSRVPIAVAIVTAVTGLCYALIRMTGFEISWLFIPVMLVCLVLNTLWGWVRASESGK